MKVSIYVALVALALLSGCGESGGSKETAPAKETARQEATTVPRESSSGREVTGLQVGFNRGAGPEHAGLYMAKKLGYFRDAGINVAFFWPIHPDKPVKYAAEGIVDLSISHPPEIVLSRNKYEPVVAVGTLVAKPTISMIWLKRSKIHDIADLEGKTVATAGLRYQDAYLEEILALADLKPSDVKIRRVGYNLLPVIRNGQADAILGNWNVEGIELRSDGLEPVVTPVTDLGIPPDDKLVWIARPDFLQRNPKTIRAFLRAAARGTAAAARDPRQATRFLLAENPGLDPKATLAEVRATLPLLSAGAAP
jgi:putative hydroxymethylpyrimidine transport system substrate-binding protein